MPADNNERRLVFAQDSTLPMKEQHILFTRKRLHLATYHSGGNERFVYRLDIAGGVLESLQDFQTNLDNLAAAFILGSIAGDIKV